MNAPTPDLKRVVTPQEAAEELLRRRRARSSLYEFLKQAWPIIEGGRKFIDGWAIGAVCEHLQAVIEGEFRDLLINIPPRMSKSTAASICLAPWAWIDHPQLQFFCLSYSDKLSIRDHVKARRLIESEWYRVRWGTEYALTDDQNTKQRYDNTKGGYRVASSITGTVTGDGGDVLCLDDPNNVFDQSDTALEAVERFWSDVMPTRLNDFNTGRRIVVQQRTHEKDLSGIIQRSKDHGWVVLRLPMEFEKAHRCVTVALPSTGGKKWADPRTEEGELLWPERINAKALARLKDELGSTYAISGQLQQRPSPGEGGIIKKKWFRIWSEPQPPKCDFIVMSIDTALSEKKEAAYHAITTWGIFSRANDKATPWSNLDDPDGDMKGKMTPNMILLSTWRGHCEYWELRKRIKRMSLNYLDDGDVNDPPRQRQKNTVPDLILIEQKSSGITLIQDLRRADVLVTGFVPDKYGDKTQRVRYCTPMLEGGRVWVPGLPPDFKKPRRLAADFIEQAGSFPKAAARDLVDTMTQTILKMKESGWIWTPGDREPGEEDVPDQVAEYY